MNQQVIEIEQYKNLKKKMLNSHIKKKNKLNFRFEKEIFIKYIKKFNQYLMLLSDRQRIIKTMNLNFKNEEDFSSCKSNKNVQLEKEKSDNFNNFDDFDDESSSSKNENENKNVDENEILSLSSSNSSANKITSASMNSTEKNR